MTDLMRQAIERVSALPPDQQDEFARVLLRLAGDEGEVYKLSPEENAAIDEADAAIARGDFATDEEMRALFDEYKL